MNSFLMLLRKNFTESRWTLGLTCASFFSLSVFTVYLTTRFEALLREAGGGTNFRRLGILRGLGGPAMDYSTTAIEICWWNHPVIVLTVLSWVIVRGAGGICGEIERGTIDITLSRPVSRATYLSSQIVFALLGLALFVFSLLLGNLVGTPFFKLNAPPTFVTLLKPAAIVMTMGMAVYGYTLPFSALDVVRWRPMLLSVAITLLGLIGMSFAPQFDGYQWLERISVFQAYAPVTVAIKGEPFFYNCTVLLVVFFAGIALSYTLFLNRDIPSNS